MVEYQVKKNRKKLYILLIFIIFVSISAPLSVYIYRDYKFKNYMDQAENYLMSEKYGQAIDTWNRVISLFPKYKDECLKDIDKAHSLIKSKAVFQDGEDYLQQGEYIKAIEAYNYVSKEDSSRFAASREKIENCKRLFLYSQLTFAEGKAITQDYKAANDMLLSAKQYVPDSILDEKINEYSDLNNKLEEARRIEEQRKLEEEKQKEEQRKQEEKKRLEAQRKQEMLNSTAIPVLMYHSIDFQEGNNLRIPKDKFRAEMKYLKDNGYTPISLDELYGCLNGTMSPPNKPVVITLDDGYEDNYTSAFPVLKEFNFKAAIFIITDNIDTNGAFLTSEQLKEMSQNGIAIESHTLIHSDLSKLGYEEQLRVLKQSREKLESILNSPVNYIAYPSGKFNSFTENAAKAAGYKLAVTTQKGLAQKKDGLYFVHRMAMYNSQDMTKFISLLSGQ
ncbi:MAG: polysaccharide deacetylase family protein [Bacillota bacterium]|nr:polysaccharide deacetylase family protein [Bacillota bacterium]